MKRELYAISKTAVEFFAGIGLMRAGLEQAGWQVIFANDIDPIKEHMYSEHFKDPISHFTLSDIHQLESSHVPSAMLATASFPCTDLSLAGRREGLSGGQSSAFWGFVNILNDMGERRPPVVLLENVEGFLSSNKGNDFKSALMALNKLGYVVDAFIINAIRFVPQSRVRLFVVAHIPCKGHSELREKQLSFYESDIRPTKLSEFIFDNPDINWHIRNLPPLPQTNSYLSDIIEDISPNSEHWWSEDRVKYLLNQTYDRHKELIKSAQGKDFFTYFTAFRRIRNGKSVAEIRSDGIAGCLRTPKGGSARQILIRAGKGEVRVRLLLPKECASLMGVSNYRVSGTINQALFGFGDAVCVPVVTWIANNYLNPLLEEILSVNNTNKIDYESNRRASIAGI